MEEEVRAKAIDLLGEAKPVSREPMKDTLMSFREGHIYVALKMVSSFDKESQSYQQPQPKITCMVDGKYIRMPIDAPLIKRFGDFLIKLGDVLEGVEIPQREIDMDEVRRKMHSFQQRLIDD